MKRYVIIGLGNFGAGVAEALHRAGHDVVALDDAPRSGCCAQASPHR